MDAVEDAVEAELQRVDGLGDESASGDGADQGGKAVGMPVEQCTAEAGPLLAVLLVEVELLLMGADSEPLALEAVTIDERAEGITFHLPFFIFQGDGDVLTQPARPSASST
ncbi:MULTISPECIES: hypothetical protein [unclassified Kitasatospora]|uniref:hypothetical protein n=1 Tax=unclassified Kitasatospora TaxID=2633591 RepID=UPI00342D7FDE